MSATACTPRMINDNVCNVAVVATYRNSIAIWNCMRQHIDLMLRTGSSVSIFISNLEKKEYIQKEYLPLLILYDNIRELKKKIKEKKINTIWYADVVTTMKYRRLGSNSRVLTWIQGTIPDESFLRNRSVVRKCVLEIIERFTFKFADGFILVSDSMKDYYERKYNVSLNHSVIVPCLSDFHNFEPTRKRVENSYVYIGGMSEWQCFDKIVEIYGKIRTQESVFHIITMETEKAEKILKAKLSDLNNISIYSVTDRQKIPVILSKFQFGFLIREESPVNYVSSPIKFLEYLSCGVNVIMTDSIPSYAKLVRDNKVGTIVPYNVSDDIVINDFSSEARTVYLNNFNRNHYINAYKKILNQK